MARLFYPEGYYFQATFEPQAYIPRVTFKYRPAEPEAVAAYFANTTKKVPDVCRFLDKRVVDWDVTDDKGYQVQVTYENLTRTPLPLLQFMVDQVSGYSGSLAQAADEKN